MELGTKAFNEYTRIHRESKKLNPGADKFKACIALMSQIRTKFDCRRADEGMHFRALIYRAAELYQLDPKEIFAGLGMKPRKVRG